MQKIQKTVKIGRKNKFWSNHPKICLDKWCFISFPSSLPVQVFFTIALYQRDYSL